MRKFSAWFLLLIATFQWAGGLLTFKIANLISEEISMTAKERSVSELYELETGVRIQVKELTEEFDYRMIGYSNMFAFSEEVEGRSASFLIGHDTTKTHVVEKTIGLSSEQKQEGQIASILQCFLTEYIYQDTDRVTPGWRLSTIKNPVYNTSSNYNFFGLLDTPPPQRFC